MDILEEIRKTVAIFDPELVKNEDGEEEEDKNIGIRDYQDAIDKSVDPEDLNFSMHNLFGDDDDEENDFEVEHFPVPQKDHDEEPIKVGDSVQKIARTDLTGKVLAVGELVEVEWTEDLTTLEYPEELIHIEDNDEEEQSKVSSLDTIPPIPLQDPDIL